jgi:hypothetical protein
MELRNSNKWTCKQMSSIYCMLVFIFFSRSQQGVSAIFIQKSVQSVDNFSKWRIVLENIIFVLGVQDKVLGLRQINNCHKVPLQVNFFR